MIHIDSSLDLTYNTLIKGSIHDLHWSQQFDKCLEVTFEEICISVTPYTIWLFIIAMENHHAINR